ncbi:MAG: hypothetical protein ACRDIV_20265 [Ktedonobacteraceae bacterium]
MSFVEKQSRQVKQVYSFTTRLLIACGAIGPLLFIVVFLSAAFELDALVDLYSEVRTVENDKTAVV